MSEQEATGSAQKPIGGFFELELSHGALPHHAGALALSTGRSCLCAILDFEKPKRCFMPHFTCNATLDPFLQRGIQLEFYGLAADFSPSSLPELEEGDCFLFTNYWGIQRELASVLSERYGSRLIVDDTHDFHAQARYPKSWSFTSARKYFGVPDGAFLYLPVGTEELEVLPEETPAFEDISTLHSARRSLGRQAEAFAAYQAYEKSLPCELLRISSYSSAVLASLDIDAAFAKRRANFDFLARALGPHNTLDLPDSPELTPFAYPFLPSNPVDKTNYYREQIFVPTYWPDVTARDGVDCEVALRCTKELIPFPIDHRYGQAEMQRMIDVTHRILNEQ